MGKASSAKKVARAARAGGKKSGTQRQWGFPVAIGLVVVLGLSLVVYARSSGRLGSDAKGHPQVNEHWHAAYGIYVCDHWIANMPDGPTDALGIHTHEDGLVHIHPFNNGAAGKQATFARFFDQVGLKVSSSEIKLPKAAPFDGRTYKVGTTTCNGKPAVITATRWKSAVTANTTKPTTTFTKDFSKIRFIGDMGAYTFAFAPKGTKIPAPPGASDILKNATSDSGAQPTNTNSTDTTSVVTVPATVGTTPATQGTTAPGSTAPAATTPASTAPATTAP